MKRCFLLFLILSFMLCGCDLINTVTGRVRNTVDEVQEDIAVAQSEVDAATNLSTWKAAAEDEWREVKEKFTETIQKKGYAKAQEKYGAKLNELNEQLINFRNKSLELAKQAPKRTRKQALEQSLKRVDNKTIWYIPIIVVAIIIVIIITVLLLPMCKRGKSSEVITVAPTTVEPSFNQSGFDYKTALHEQCTKRGISYDEIMLQHSGNAQRAYDDLMSGV